MAPIEVFTHADRLRLLRVLQHSKRMGTVLLQDGFEYKNVRVPAGVAELGTLRWLVEKEISK